MMATLRRQHGGGRDFLQENKQRVSRMDTNGRCLAAASARQVPMWRPVVLHYAEKPRPHYPISQRLPRQVPASTDVRSGLAQPYMESAPVCRSQSLPKLPAPPCGCELTKRRHANEEQQVRLQGGWVDPRRKERPIRCCSQNCHCRQVQQPVEVPQLRQGEGDQADRVSQCSSRVSRRSQKERSSAGEENAEPEAPLSARSSASAVTLKSKRSASQESRRSTATVKSNITVASQKSNTTVGSQNTIASKNSQLGRRSRDMEVMPLPDDPRSEHQHHHRHQLEQKEQQQPHRQETAHHEDFEGYTPLTPSQKRAALEDAQFKYGKLMEEYNHLPVSAPTMRVRSRKVAIEKQLDELDYAINMFDQPHMDMYYKR